MVQKYYKAQDNLKQRLLVYKVIFGQHGLATKAVSMNVFSFFLILFYFILKCSLNFIEVCDEKSFTINKLNEYRQADIQ